MTHDIVQTAHYGLGAFFPIVVLDPEPRWHKTAPTALPECSPKARGVLALRWYGQEDQAAEGLLLLSAAARRAPRVLDVPPRLVAYRAALPRSLQLIALPESAVIGPWSQRPGAGCS
ncbi:hypothetical protein ACWGI8_34360 [Streptomyces sp. NPDC054841]